METQYDLPANSLHLIRTGRLFLVIESKGETWTAQYSDLAVGYAIQGSVPDRVVLTFTQSRFQWILGYKVVWLEDEHVLP